MRPGTAEALTRIAGALEPRFPLRLLGFGLIYVWSSCVWEMAIFSPTRASAATGDLFDIWLWSALLTPIACIACAIAGRKRELIEMPALLITGPLLATVGTLCIAFYPYADGPLRLPLSIAAALGTGIGPALMVVLWVGLYARLDTDTVEAVVPASFFVIIVCMLIIPYLPASIAGPITVLLPFGSAILLLMGSCDETASMPASLARTDPIEEAQPYPLSSVLRMFLLVFVAYSISCTIPALQQETELLAPEAVTNIIGILFAIAVSTAIVLFSARIDLGVYFRWMSTPLILSAVLTGFPSPLTASLASLLANAMFTSLEIIMILYFIRLARMTQRPVSFFIGIGACATYSGVLVGYMLGAEWAALAAQGAMGIQGFCLILVGAFAFAMLLVPRHDSALSGTPDPKAAEDTPDDQHASFDALCEGIAASYSLSKRETDVFKLLAQGRSQPYIRDTLFLSKNTVSTHIRHIYRKLDIHSKEELIDMLVRR